MNFPNILLTGAYTPCVVVQGIPLKTNNHDRTRKARRTRDNNTIRQNNSLSIYHLNSSNCTIHFIHNPFIPNLI